MTQSMAPEQRKAARERLDLFLGAKYGVRSPVSRAELAGYLFDALNQIDADEGLLREVLAVISDLLDMGHEEPICPRLDAIENALLARLGDPAPEVKP